MPYIKHDKRRGVRNAYDPNDAGELNYYLTCIINGYLDKKGVSYQTLNDISGAMTEALAEFRRRVIAPYEDEKIKQNGDLTWYKHQDEQRLNPTNEEIYDGIYRR